MLLDFRTVAWKPNPWLYFLVWLNSWWSLLVSYIGKALERGCLFMDWAGRARKAWNWNVCLQRIFFWLWWGKSGILEVRCSRIHGVFFPFSPLPGGKRELLYGESGRTGDCWHRRRSQLPRQHWCHPSLLSLSGLSASEAENYMCTLHFIWIVGNWIKVRFLLFLFRDGSCQNELLKTWADLLRCFMNHSSKTFLSWWIWDVCANLLPVD